MIIDFHNDTLLKLYLYNYDLNGPDSSLDIDKHKVLMAKEQGTPIKALFFAACTYPVSERHEVLPLVKQMACCFNKELAKVSDVFAPAYSLKDMERINAEGRTAVFLCLEGAYAVTAPEHVDELYELGFRLFTLTHNRSSSWVGSCTEPEHGLINNGIEIIKRMNELGVIIDVAHASDKAILDIVNVTSRPIVFSHGGVKAISGSRRALEDDIIKAVASTGGLIGITVYPEQITKLEAHNKNAYDRFFEKRNQLFDDLTLSPHEKLKRYCDLSYFEFPIPDMIPSYEAIFDNIDHIVHLVGDDHVCIGTDYDGVRYKCTGLEDVSKLYLIKELMQKKGYALSRIEKILSNNIVKLMSRI